MAPLKDGAFNYLLIWLISVLLKQSRAISSFGQVKERNPSQWILDRVVHIIDIGSNSYFDLQDGPIINKTKYSLLKTINSHHTDHFFEVHYSGIICSFDVNGWDDIVLDKDKDEHKH